MLSRLRATATLISIMRRLTKNSTLKNEIQGPSLPVHFVRTTVKKPPLAHGVHALPAQAGVAGML
jgi:hypothetical protein